MLHRFNIMVHIPGGGCICGLNELVVIICCCCGGGRYSAALIIVGWLMIWISFGLRIPCVANCMFCMELTGTCWICGDGLLCPLGGQWCGAFTTKCVLPFMWICWGADWNDCIDTGIWLYICWGIAWLMEGFAWEVIIVFPTMCCTVGGGIDIIGGGGWLSAIPCIDDAGITVCFDICCIIVPGGGASSSFTSSCLIWSSPGFLSSVPLTSMDTWLMGGGPSEPGCAIVGCMVVCTSSWGIEFGGGCVIIGCDWTIIWFCGWGATVWWMIFGGGTINAVLPCTVIICCPCGGLWNWSNCGGGIVVWTIPWIGWGCGCMTCWIVTWPGWCGALLVWIEGFCWMYCTWYGGAWFSRICCGASVAWAIWILGGGWERCGGAELLICIIGGLICVPGGGLLTLVMCGAVWICEITRLFGCWWICIGTCDWMIVGGCWTNPCGGNTDGGGWWIIPFGWATCCARIIEAIWGTWVAWTSVGCWINWKFCFGTIFSWNKLSSSWRVSMRFLANCFAFCNPSNLQRNTKRYH